MDCRSVIRTVTVAALFACIAARAEIAFDKDVLPILQKACSSCHFPPVEPLKGKLDLSTIDSILKGGAEGAVVVPGKADESRLVQMVEGTLEPLMPPKGKGDPLTPAAIAILKQWINEGAKGAVAPPATAPAEPPSAAAPTAPAPETSIPQKPAPITSIAYAPTGDQPLLARGSLHTVELLNVDPQSGATSPVATLDGHAEMVRALAFSPDGVILAAGGGKPGRGGEIKLWRAGDRTLLRTIEGHKDNVLALAFSPDGKRLVSASYDKNLIIWDVESGAAVSTLANHVDAVYTVAWSPKGDRIASGAGDRTVKIWSAADGKLLATISDSADAVLTVAFSPDGATLAGAGADKIIRLWDMSASDAPLEQSGSTAGRLKASTFAHEGAVLHILYAPDGATLYSTGEDKRIKAWDASTLAEKQAFEQQSDWVTALALDPKGALLAAGRYDATTTIYAADSGKPLSGSADQGKVASASGPKKITSLSVEAVIIRATVPPSLQSIAPDRWHRGAEIDLAVSGKNLDRAQPISTNPGVTVEVLETEALPEPELKLGEGPRGTGADILDNARPYRMKLRMKTAADAPLGRYELLFRTPLGITNGAAFTVIPAPDTGETEPNNDTPQAVQWPGVVIGAINASGDVDRYSLSVKAGDEIVFAVTDSALATVMRLLDAAGNVVVSSNDAGEPKRNRMGYKVPADGDYTVELADADLRAGLGYRLHIGRFPMVTALWPLGVPAGPPTSIAVEGFNLPANTLTVDPPDTAALGATMPLPIPVPEGSPVALPVLAVSPHTDLAEVEPNNGPSEAQPLAFPSVVNARIDKRSGETDVDYFHFSATNDRPIVLETVAAKLGSPLDSKIEILDKDGNILQRAVLRCVAETALTLSARDSRSAGLRLENWRDIKINDYVMVGGEVIQVARIPGYGDEDVIFKQYPNGQRIGYFATTPEHHAVFDRIYKVTVHPVGTTFAPNGMPVFPIYWRNDDGFNPSGETTGDSSLEFHPPADGDYIVRVSDVRGEGGSRYAYRLLLRAPDPDFDVFAGPYYINIAPGSRVPFDVRVLRRDGFNGNVVLSVPDLPEGFSVELESVLPDEDLVRCCLVAGPGAQSTPFDTRFRILAQSEWNGRTYQHETALGAITVTEKQPDLVVHCAENTLDLAPGQLGALNVTLERNNGFDSRSPISVLNLPFGVRVMYTGLNGILVREGETQRRIEIMAEPWVQPMTRTIYVQAQIETQTAQKPTFLSQPIQLRIGDQQKIAKRN